MKKSQMMAKNDRLKELQHMRDWIHSHPHRVDPEVQPAAIDFLNNSILELDKSDEMKKTLRPGRVRLRDRLRTLLSAIVTQSMADGK